MSESMSQIVSDEALMQAFDDELGIEPEQPEETPAEEGVPAGEPAQPAEVEEEEGDLEEPGEETEEEEEPEEPEEDAEEEATGDTEELPASAFTSDDPEILAYLARYDNNPESALKAAVELQRVLGRQGRENGQLKQRVQELEAQIVQARAFTQSPLLLNEQQRAWVEEANGSGQQAVYVQQAIEAGEYDLARAVVEEWATEQPYQALRAGQMIDQAEYFASQPVDEGPAYNPNELLQILTEHFPEMPRYEAQMVTVLANLGEGHPLVAAARSSDPEQAARGIIGIYEVARASSASVKSARDGVKKRTRESAQAVRDQAVVSSGEASPAATQTPRPVQIAPGLTLEALDAEWAKNT